MMVKIRFIFTIPIVLLSALTLAGCGISGHAAATPTGHGSNNNASPVHTNGAPGTSGGSALGTATGTTPSPTASTVPVKTTVLKLRDISARIPASWTMGAPTTPFSGVREIRASAGSTANITLHQYTLTASHIFQLVPQVPKPPGLTGNHWNVSPYFTETEQQAGGSVDARVTDLTPSGTEDVVDLHMPASQSGLAHSILKSITLPSPASVSQAVHLLLAKSTEVMPDLATARAGAGDRWLLAGGSPATAQEGWFLFRSTDSGKSWSLINHTAWKKPAPVFPGSVGAPGMLFWTANDGVIVQPSFASPQLAVYRTTDGGTTWQVTFLKSPGQPNDGKPPQITRFADGKLTVTAHLCSGRTFQASSTNGGKSWTPS